MTPPPTFRAMAVCLAIVVPIVLLLALLMDRIA